MIPSACYAGVIVRDLERSIAWYSEHLGCTLVESGQSWAALELSGGSRVELTVGDPSKPGSGFPSYGGEAGPPVLPGYNVEEPDVLALGLAIVRQLPDWIVVVAPDRVRLVLTRSECDTERGLVGFRWHSPDPEGQQLFLEGLGVTALVEPADAPRIVPLIRSSRTGALTDPDGLRIELVAEGAA